MTGKMLRMQSNNNILFKNFDIFSQSEKSVNNFKSLVFQLTLKGKLDFQKLSHSKIKKPLQTLIQEQKVYLKKEDTAFEEKSNSVWPIVKLKDVCFEERKTIKGQSKQANKLPYLSLDNIESRTGKIILDRSIIKREGKSNCFLFNSNHILYGKLRPYLNKVALPDFEGRCTTEAIPLCVKKNIHKIFLAYILRTENLVLWVMSSNTGTRMPRANLKQFFKFQFPLPPLAVQEEIVSLMEKCSLLESQTKERSQKQNEFSKSSMYFITQSKNKKEMAHRWETLKNNFKDALYSESGAKEFKAMAFQLCLNGKLDFQKLSHGKIKKSLQTLIQEQKQHLKKEGIAFEETPDSVWPMVELGDVCKLYQPKTISQKQMIKNGEYVVFGANGIIGRYDKYNHKESEVLITCRGATCGTINLSEPKSWITGNAMVSNPLSNSISKKFLFYLLKQSDFNSVISGAAQPQITRHKLSPFKIPLPPLEVQKEIIALMTYMENLKKQIQKEKV